MILATPKQGGLSWKLPEADREHDLVATEPDNIRQEASQVPSLGSETDKYPGISWASLSPESIEEQHESPHQPGEADATGEALVRDLRRSQEM